MNTPTQMLNQNFEVSQISAGYDFTMILSTEGFLYSCGDNNVCLLYLTFQFGQLGDPSNTLQKRMLQIMLPVVNNRIIKICSGYRSTMILKGNGKVYAFGYNPVF
jgi:alpha-tubulin suppressor-like RCC1 family protein